MWCSQDCYRCNDSSCKCYSPTLSEDEHALVVKNLELNWVGKKTPDDTKIMQVVVDYRKSHQYMNRVMDEYGNFFYIEELEKWRNRK